MGKPKCPKCETSEFVVLINTGEKVGTGVGAIAGGATTTLGTTGGAEIGASVGLIAGPAGAVIGSVAGGIIGFLVGATAGGIVGKKTGEIIDNSRSLYQCNKCNNEFNG